MIYRERECRECGVRFRANTRNALFHSPACKQAFNNRRYARGAELYDFLMIEGLRSTIVRDLLQSYKSADLLKRNGRQSYMDLETAIRQLPVSLKSGDGR